MVDWRWFIYPCRLANFPSPLDTAPLIRALKGLYHPDSCYPAHTTNSSVSVLRINTLILAVCAAISPFASEHRLSRSIYESLVELRAPTCRMPLGPFQDTSQADLGGRVTPVLASSSPLDTSSTVRLRSPLSCLPDHVRAFLQRSPPSLLTIAASCVLRSAPPSGRALLHLLYICDLSYICAPPCGPAVLVTQDYSAD
jgi:hypothetical protein